MRELPPAPGVCQLVRRRGPARRARFVSGVAYAFGEGLRLWIVNLAASEFAHHSDNVAAAVRAK